MGIERRGCRMQFSLDEIDLKLLRYLQENGRTTNKLLADHIGLSPTGCIKRVQLLENAGIISGYHARVEPEQVGLGLQAFLRVSLARHDRDDLYRFIADVKSWPEVVACYTTSGDGDFLLHVMTPDLHHYRNFIMDKLTLRSLIGNISSSLVLGVEKCSAHVPLGHLEP